MKLCITSAGKDIESKIDERFGRSPYFLFVDTDTMDFKAVPNTAETAGRGAGIRAVQLIVDNEADAVLTGVVGPNAFEALKAAKVNVYEGASELDTVKNAVEGFKKGDFKEVSCPAEGHGSGRGRGRGGFRGGR
ncbi:MAG: dinitrogenase iron-molybdenum cofactor biosynthesis protein [Candidatus Kuenenia sp.]|nr:dinitrogenase iron-molybdenum cofactor biosynthesis protein [Candidatus Kuenenia hertensis]